MSQSMKGFLMKDLKFFSLSVLMVALCLKASSINAMDGDGNDGRPNKGTQHHHSDGASDAGDKAGGIEELFRQPLPGVLGGMPRTVAVVEYQEL